MALGKATRTRGRTALREYRVSLFHITIPANHRQFLEENPEISEALRTGSSTTKLKDSWMKIRWAMCQQEDLARFQTDLAAHTQSINIIIAALQVVGGHHTCPVLVACWIFTRTTPKIKIANAILNTNQWLQLIKTPLFNAW
jgi:hypothetical protein